MSHPAAPPAPIYLDHHATTPCDPRVVEAMLPWFSERFANAASTTYPAGRAAREAVERARVQVAALIGASPKEIVFTSGATESNNLALKGLVAAYPERADHLVTAPTEHRAVLETCEALAASGARTSFAAVGADGVVTADAVEAALEPETLVVAVMAANNEIGTVAPVAEIGALCRERGVFFMTDAVQAVGRVPFDVKVVGCDLASLSAHKIYGPKGVGALYVRRRPRVRLEPLIHGGGHERGHRSGTLNVPGIVGFGAACALARQEGAAEAARVGALRDRLLAGLRERAPDLHVNGSLSARLPHNLNVAFPRVEARKLIEVLGNVAVSSGSACSTEDLQPSHVLRALGLPDTLAYSAVRFGLGRGTTEAEIAAVIARVGDAVARLRR